MPEQTLADYNVIAVFEDEDRAREAIAGLHDLGIESEKLSYLGAQAEARREEISGDAQDPPTTTEVPKEVGKQTLGAGVAGGAVGGAAGFLTGLVAVGIPGAGPLVGAGVWAATAYGAAAGSTVGGVSGGISKMFDMHYKDHVAGGGALVGVHSEDKREVAQAGQVLAEHRPARVDVVDPEGKIKDIP
jgi:hypothetical protein